MINKMQYRKSSFWFHLVSSILLCFSTIPRNGFCSQSFDKNGGITYFDNSQNIDIKDRVMMRNDVFLIKDDCGNICNTSYESERSLHKGKITSEVVLRV